MSGNESVLAQMLSYFAYPMAMYFYALIGAIVSFTAYEVFNRREQRKETEDFYRSLLEIHKSEAIRRAIKEDEEEKKS